MLSAIDSSVNLAGEGESRRQTARRRRPAHRDPGQGPQPRDGRPPRARAPRPTARASSCCPRSGRVLGTRRATCAPAPSRSTARRSTWARERRARAGHRPRRRLDLRARRRARTSCATPRCTSAPTARSRPPTARSTCSTSRSTAPSTASPSTRSPATRSSLSATADGVELGLTVCYDLRFPELYRDPRGARRAHPHRPGRLHARRPRATTGRCSCAPARSRTRLRHRRQPDRRARRRACAPAGAR